jgi:hypothetical protein
MKNYATMLIEQVARYNVQEAITQLITEACNALDTDIIEDIEACNQLIECYNTLYNAVHNTQF